ncbi:hypothetical protein PUMCH_003509 [Australozyma saopauloensis]|nr:hypothetical protein PUMCH_003509 [[Candida] saopauloensis]
MLYPSNI